jgi:transcriptional regulator with XRE-family HTH domain
MIRVPLRIEGEFNSTKNDFNYTYTAMGLTQSGEIRIGARLRQQRLTRGLTMSEVAEQAGLTAGFISQLERDLTSVSLSSLYRICAVLGIRAGDLIDDVPEGRLIRRDEQARRSLAMGDTEHLLLSSGDERRFHVTESRIPPGVSAGEELYTLPADVELAYVVQGSLEMRVGEETHLIEEGDTFTYSPRDPHTWRNPSATEDAVVLWFAVPNPYVV